ncbi:MAG: PAS domain S-box protein [Betaproteobacteria bacterium]|nr:PAS domain S-box protein [Betaproteobacteria bacterium]
MPPSPSRSTKTDDRAPPWSLTFRLNLLVALTAVLVLAGIAYELLRQTVDELSETESVALRLADHAAVNVERFVDDSRVLLERLAKRPAIAALDATACDAAFRDFPDLLPQHRGLLSVTRDGTVVCRSAPPDATTAESPDLREVLARVVQDGVFILGKPRAGAGGRAWHLPLAQPLKDGDGAVVGMLVLLADPAAVLPMVFDARSAGGGVVAIDDGAGALIAGRADPSPERTISAQSRGSTAKVRAADGVDRLYGYQAILGTDWRTMVGVPAERLGSRPVAAAARFALLGGVVLALAVIALVALRVRLLRGLDSLFDAARAVTGGLPQSRAQVAAPAEIARLGGAFNAMLDKLDHDQRSLEETHDALLATLRRAGAAVYAMAPGRRRLLYLSPSADAIHGRAAADFVEHPPLWDDAVHEEDREALQARYKQLLLGAPFEAEYRIVRGDGTLRWVRDSAWLETDAQGRPQRIHGFVIDISDRKEVDLTLRESLQHFRAISEANPLPLCVATVEGGQVRYANDALLQTLGLERGACVGRGLAQLCADPRALEQLTQAVERGHGTARDLQLRRADGSYLWVAALVRLSAYDDEPAWYLAFSDNTARLQLEHSLRAAEQRLRALIGLLAEGVMLVDASGRIADCNAGAAHILGVEHGSLLGLMPGSPRWQGCFEDGTAVARHTHPAAVALASARASRDQVLSVRRPDGSRIWLSWNVQPLFHSDSPRPYAAMASFIDITAARRAEHGSPDDGEATALPGAAESEDAPAMPEPAALLAMDGDGFVIRCDGEVQRLLGVEVQDIVGLPLAAFVAEGDAPAFEGYLVTLGSGGWVPMTLLGADNQPTPVDVLITMQRADGGREFSVALRPVDARDAGGHAAASHLHSVGG